MSDLAEPENPMKMLSDLFKKYAAGDGDDSTLTRGELKKLLKDEAGLGPECSSMVDQLVKALDDDGDNKMSFSEFLTMLMALSQCAPPGMSA